MLKEISGKDKTALLRQIPPVIGWLIKELIY